MLRIVFYNHTGTVSGAEGMLLLGLSRLPRNAFDLVLICPETGSLAAAAAERGIPVHTGPAIVARFTWNPILLVRYITLLLSGVWGLRRTFRKLQPDIIHANTVRAGIAATLATAGTKVPIVWHNHDMLPSSHPVTLGIRFLIWASGRVRIVACSAAAANTLRPLSRSQPQPTVIYNGCKVDRTRPEEPERAQKRAEIGVAREQFVIASVGQITPRKGQLELIQAFSRVRTHIPHAVLALCGSPLFDHDRSYLERLYEETDRLALNRSVQFLGHREDAVEIVGASDLCILNSNKEPFALTIIEAMAIGTPVVATDCGGPSEAVRHGIDGEIVPVGDPGALVRTIVRLAADPALRAKYAAAGELSVKQRFSREQYIRRWCTVYEETHNASRQFAQHPGRPVDLQVNRGAPR
jgi:glycosyltransferase involved in cell wall biosynthesis